MKNYKRINRIIEELYVKEIMLNDERHKRTAKNIIKTFNHIRQYWMVYWFLITKIFAIAMLGMGIHCVVAHFNKVLPFGIVSENMGLWFIWAYAGWFIGCCMIGYGIMKLFEHTINKWLRTL